MPREAAVRKVVRDELKARGAFFVPYSPYPYGVAGTPDLVCCYRGVSLWVETKQPKSGAMASPRQLLVHDQIRRAGGVVVVARRREDVRRVLDAIDSFLDVAFVKPGVAVGEIVTAYLTLASGDARMEA